MRKVSGNVTYQGNAVEGAIVTFVPDASEGIPASGGTDAKGGYLLTSTSAQVPGSGTKPGKYKITVAKMEPYVAAQYEDDFKSGKIGLGEYMKLKEADRARATVKVRKNMIPPKYAAVDTTPLTFTVEDKAMNEFNIELVD